MKLSKWVPSKRSSKIISEITGVSRDKMSSRAGSTRLSLDFGTLSLPIFRESDVHVFVWKI